MVTVSGTAEHGPMAHALGLARLLDSIEDDDRFLDELDRSFFLLLGLRDPGAIVLIDVLADRVDAILAAAHTRPMPTNCCDTHDGPHVHGCTLGRGPGGAAHPGACLVEGRELVLHGSYELDDSALTCPCGKDADHVDAPEDSPEWACRVPDVSRETGVTNGADVSRETNVSRETDVTHEGCPECEMTLWGPGRFPSAPR